MELTITTRSVDDHTVVSVAGEIDVYTAPQLRVKLVDLVDAGDRHLVVDMRNVDFLDSTGLGVLVGTLKRVKAANGSLALVCTQERIVKIFRITGLERVFTIASSVEDAIDVALGDAGRPSPTQ